MLGVLKNNSLMCKRVNILYYLVFKELGTCHVVGRHILQLMCFVGNQLDVAIQSYSENLPRVRDGTLKR